MPRTTKPKAAEKPADDVGDVCLAFNLRRASRLVSQVYDNAYRFMGLRNTQFSVLYALSKIQPATMRELSAELDVDRTTLTRNLGPLEKDGYVTREPGEDQREKKIALTKKGADTLREGFPAWCAVQTKIEEIYGAENMAQLVIQLRKLAEALG